MNGQGFIKISGILFLIMPVFNFVISIQAVENVENKWSLVMMTRILLSFPKLVLALWAMTAIVGIVTLMRKNFYYKIIIPMVALYVFLNLTSFLSDMHSGLFKPVVSLAANLSFVFFIIRRMIQDLELPTVYFEGVGPWARLSSVTKSHVRLQRISEPPEGIESRLLEIEIKPKQSLKLKYEKKTGAEYLFRRVS